MNIEIAEVNYSKIIPTEITDTRFILHDVPVSLSNSLRRTLESRIPNIGIYEKDVKVIENTTALHDEFMAHRTSLIPIYRDSRMKFLSRINKTTGYRKYMFESDSLVIIFVLNEHNTDTFPIKAHFRDIMSNQFRVFQKIN